MGTVSFTNTGTVLIDYVGAMFCKDKYADRQPRLVALRGSLKPTSLAMPLTDLFFCPFWKTGGILTAPFLLF